MAAFKHSVLDRVELERGRSPTHWSLDKILLVVLERRPCPLVRTDSVSLSL
jgi:hypothetical protein